MVMSGNPYKIYEKAINFLNLICDCYIPLWIQKRQAFILLRRIVSFFLIYLPYVRSYKLEAKINGKSFRILYVGRGHEIGYISDAFYLGNNIEIASPIRLSIWNVPQRISILGSQSDLIVVEINKLFAEYFLNKGYFIIPKWLYLEVDVSKALEQIRISKSIKSDIRRIRKFMYSYEIDTLSKKINYFYYNMYLPYVFMRYGRQVEPYSFRHIKKIAMQGHLLLIKQENEYISGIIYSTNRKKMFLHSVGVKDGEYNYVKKGGLSAAYYYSVLLAKRYNCETISFGLVRPLLNDGVLRYKQKWGTKIKDADRGSNVFALKFVNPDKLNLEFLKQTPVIFQQNRQIGCICCIDAAMSSITSFLRQSLDLGIDKLIVVTPIKSDAQVRFDEIDITKS